MQSTTGSSLRRWPLALARLLLLLGVEVEAAVEHGVAVDGRVEGREGGGGGLALRRQRSTTTLCLIALAHFLARVGIVAENV